MLKFLGGSDNATSVINWSQCDVTIVYDIKPYNAEDYYYGVYSLGEALDGFPTLDYLMPAFKEVSVYIDLPKGEPVDLYFQNEKYIFSLRFHAGEAKVSIGRVDIHNVPFIYEEH